MTSIALFVALAYNFISKWKLHRSSTVTHVLLKVCNTTEPHCCQRLLQQRPPCHSLLFFAELVLRVRLANSSETDFLEIELDKTQLTYQVLLNTMCSELDVDPRVVINKVRKLPNIIVRKDKDVRRLVDFQELELFITESALIRQYPLPKLDF